METGGPGGAGVCRAPVGGARSSHCRGRGRRGPAPTGVVRKSLAGLLRRLPEAAVAEGKGISSGSQSTTFPSPWKLHYVQHLKAWHRPARRVR